MLAEIRKPRPAVIMSNDWQNEVSQRAIVLSFSTQTEKVYYPIELLIESGKIMCDQDEVLVTFCFTILIKSQ